MLQKKRIIIIGGSSGIGLNLSERLLALDAEIVVGSRSPVKLSKAKKLLSDKITTFQIDASEEDSVVKFFDKIGSFDHLIITIKPDHLVCDFSESSVSSIRDAFDNKFWGQYSLVRHCLKNISTQGSIILTSGIATNRSYQGFSGTAAINGAIESFVKSVSAEISPIRINAVSPGFIERHNNDSSRYEYVKKLGANPLVGRLGTQDEVSQAYIYLLQNTYSTGSILQVEGGELCV